VTAGARTLAKALIGTVIEVLRPDLARAIDSPAPRPQGQAAFKTRKWILEARLTRARWRGDQTAVRNALAGFWRNDTADFFYDRFQERFERSFLGPHQAVVDELVAWDSTHPFQYLVEIGCGDGRVLAHCAARLPGIPRLTGIDINPMIIARNRKVWADQPRLSFTATDATAWLATESRPATALLSYGGVMEYFDPAGLAAIFAGLASHPGTAVALVEPLAPDHDLAVQTRSRIFGPENSFSHNYPHLLQTAGFHIRFRRELNWDGARWLMLLATDRQPDPQGGTT
jgi:trans-aconitate methyltransferase